MRKIVLLAVCAAILLCGCYRTELLDLPAGGQTKGETSMGKTTIGTSQTATQDTQSQIDELKSRLAALESQITELKNTTATTVKTQETTSAKPTTSTTATTTTTTVAPTTTVPPKKTIPLNVETKRGDGTLTFTSLQLDYKWHFVAFFYKTSAERAFVPDSEETFLTGKSGKRYENGGMGGISGKADDEGLMYFEDITDFSDLSTVTITYKFEKFDPVTVTFDIPGI